MRNAKEVPMRWLALGLWPRAADTGGAGPGASEPALRPETPETWGVPAVAETHVPKRR